MLAYVDKKSSKHLYFGIICREGALHISVRNQALALKKKSESRTSWEEESNPQCLS